MGTPSWGRLVGGVVWVLTRGLDRGALTGAHTGA